MAPHDSSTDREQFVRHRGPVTCVAGVPGRNAAVSSAYDGAVAWLDLEAGRMELLGYHDHLANRITVDEAGKRAASCSSDYTIYLWDLENRRLERKLLGHWDDVEDFAFVDDHVGVSVSRDHRVLVWDLDTGAITRVVEGHEKDVLAVAVADGRIYTSGDDMTLRIWDLATGAPLRKWGPFEVETDTCAIDPVRRRAVLGCDDGVIRVFDIDGGASLAEIPAHASGIKKVATSPVDGDILSAAYDQRIVVWDAETFEKKVELEHRATTWERSFNWAPDGRTILAGTFDGTGLVWDGTTGRFLAEIGDKGEGNVCLNDVSANERGDLAVVSDDGHVRLGTLTADAATWVAEVAYPAGRMLTNAVTLDDPTGVVVTGAHDQVLHVFDRTGSELRHRVERHLGEGPINCVRVAHHPRVAGQVFAACYSGAIVRATLEGEVVARPRVHDGAVKALRLHPTEEIGVSGSADNTLHAWDFEGNVIRRFPGHMAIVDDVDVDPGGDLIASVSRDFTLKVYELRTGLLLHSLPLGRRSPKGVCFHDSKTVIVTNYWGALIRFDLETGESLLRPIAKNGISGISRAGEHVVAVSYDGTASLVRPTDLVVLNTLRCMTQRLVPSAMI